MSVWRGVEERLLAAWLQRWLPVCGQLARPGACATHAWPQLADPLPGLADGERSTDSQVGQEVSGCRIRTAPGALAGLDITLKRLGCLASA